MKTMIKLALVLIILVIVLAGVAIWQIDSIAKAAIEEGGTYALGTSTTVDKVHIGLLSGEASIEGLGVANPTGFPTEHGVMHSGLFSVQVDTGTLRQDTVVIPDITLDGLEVYLDRKDGKYNIQVISDNLKKLGGEKEPQEKPKEEEKPGKKYVVKKITIRNVSGRADLPTGGSVPIKVPEIVLNDVSSDEGVKMDQLIGQLFPAIMGSVISGVGELPGEVVNLLKNDLGGAAAALGGKATELLDQGFKAGAESLKNLTKDLPGDAGKVIDDATKGVGDALKNITGGDKESGDGGDAVDKIKEGLGGLLGGDKKDKE